MSDGGKPVSDCEQPVSDGGNPVSDGRQPGSDDEQSKGMLVEVRTLLEMTYWADTTSFGAIVEFAIACAVLRQRF